MRFATLLIRFRRPILLAVVPLTVAAALVGLGIRFDFTPQAVHGGNGDLVEYAEAFQDAFGHDDAVVMLLLEAEGEADVVSPAALTWTAAFAEAAARVPGAGAVTSLATVQVPEPRGRGVRWVPLLPDFPPDAQALENLEGFLAKQPLLRQAFLADDRRLAAIHVHLAPGSRDVDAQGRVVQALRARVATHPPASDLRVRWSGLPVIYSEVVKDLRHEQVARIPLLSAVFFLVLLIAFRRVRATVLLLVSVGIGIVWTAAVLVLMGHALNIISNILPVLLFTVGVANGVHVLNRYAEEYHRTPHPRTAAVRTISHMALACLLTYLTTAVGFLSLLAARSEVLRDVGWEMGVGLALLYVATIVVLGALLPSLRPPRHPAVTDATRPALSRVVGAAGYAVARHPWPILACSFVLIGLSLWSARTIPVNCRIMETYTDDHPVSASLRLTEERLGGVLAIDVSLSAEDPKTFLAPAVQHDIRAIQAHARTEADVLRVRSLVDLQDAVLLSAGLSAAAGEPGDASASAESQRSKIAVAHGLCTQFADLLGYRRYLTADGRRARIEVRIRDAGSSRVLALAGALEDELAARFPGEGPVRTRLTGDGYVAAAAMDHFIRDMFLSLLGAAVLIFGVIALLFRSHRLGLISMLPNLMPLILTLGYMGLRGYEMNASSVIVFAISLGVAVDNTIHFLARFREEWGRDGDLAAAVQRTLYSAGRAMVLTALLLVLGLLVLRTSDFLPTRRFAELTTVTMVAALLGDLLLLPACLRLCGGRKFRRTQTLRSAR